MTLQRICLTGATGHLGNVLARELAERGHAVRALVLPGDDLRPLEGVRVETVTGDLGDPASLERAFHGCELVFHLAGMISISRGEAKRLWKVNVEGTKNVVGACRRTGVRRLVYTSSVHAFTEPPPGGVLDETAGFDQALAVGDYGKTKAAASLAVLEAAQADLDAVLVCPTGVVGPWDFRLSEMGTLVRDFGAGRMRVGIEGSYDFIDVRDVARGHILAAERGRRGEAYLLNSERVTVREMMRALSEATGHPEPGWYLPLWAARPLAAMAPAWYALSRARPRFTSYAVHTLSVQFQISDAKARRELGHMARPVAESLRDQWLWMREEPSFAVA